MQAAGATPNPVWQTLMTQLQSQPGTKQAPATQSQPQQQNAQQYMIQANAAASTNAQQLQANAAASQVNQQLQANAAVSQILNPQQFQANAAASQAQQYQPYATNAQVLQAAATKSQQTHQANATGAPGMQANPQAYQANAMGAQAAAAAPNAQRMAYGQQPGYPAPQTPAYGQQVGYPNYLQACNGYPNPYLAQQNLAMATAYQNMYHQMTQQMQAPMYPPVPQHFSAPGRDYMPHQKTVPCKFRDNCKFGDRCKFSHDPNMTWTSGTAVQECRNWNLNGKCRNGSNCPRKHDDARIGSFKPTVECKIYQNGYCRHGDYCTYLHIGNGETKANTCAPVPQEGVVGDDAFKKALELAKAGTKRGIESENDSNKRAKTE